MRKVGIRIKLNVSAIEKERLFKGQKGVYLDATCFINLDEKDQYDNNGFVSQDVSKEEREANVKGPILGNVQVFYDKDDGQTAGEYRPPAPSAAQRPADDFDDDIPF